MKFSLPSITQIIENVYKITLRFPFVLTTAFLATVGAVLFIEISFGSSYEPNDPFKLWLVGGLGISLLYGLTVFTEQRNWNNLAKTGIQAGGFLLLVVYYFVLGDDIEHHPHQVWYQFTLFGLAAHLFAAFAPFLNPGKTDQFWEYNKALFLRFLLSALYSGVLFVGLSVAVLSFSELLEFEVDGARYGQLFVILGGVFNTGFFLAGVPEKESLANSELNFPIGLRRFSQYVLIPLVTVYIVILYLYVGKIILQWELPNGWVSNLVLTFSIAGILSLLLLYPIRESEESTWVKVYSKYYYLALIPLIGLLIFSIWVRISEYGVTINRYFVATLGVWLTGIVVYYIFSKPKNIKVIPISLCVIALGVSFGPLGASAVSERSQLGRFEEILHEFGYLDKEGKAQKSETEIPFEERKELSSIAEYVVENHGLESFSIYWKDGIEEALDSPIIDELRKNGLGYVRDSDKIILAFGVKLPRSWEEENNTIGDYYNFEISKDDAYEVSGFDEILISGYMGSNTIDIKGDYDIIYHQDSDIVQVQNRLTRDSITFSVAEKIDSLIMQNQGENRIRKDFLSSEMFVFSENDVIKGKLYIEQVSGYKSDTLWVKHLRTNILIKEK